jgi:tripartite-type tricarboxylate transporter receptor subunit TctC
MNKRILVAAAAAALCLPMTAWPQAATESYPNKPIRIIVTTPPGSGIDFFTRTVAQPLGEMYRQTVVVENRPGAGGLIGAGTVAAAAPDGYTLGAASTAHIVAPLMLAKPPYRPIEDFTPIAQMAALSFILVVGPTVPAKSVKELIVLAKAQPKKYNFGSLGNGTAAQLGAEIFNKAAGIDVVHVPFKSGSDLYTAILSGDVHYATLFVPTAGVMRSGKARVIAVTSRARNPLLPDVPTVAEAGLPAAESEALMGFVGPAKLPAALVRKLNADIVTVLRKPETRERYATQGSEPTVNTTPADYAAKLKAEYELYRKLLPQIGLAPR